MPISAIRGKEKSVFYLDEQVGEFNTSTPLSTGADFVIEGKIISEPQITPITPTTNPC